MQNFKIVEGNIANIQGLDVFNPNAVNVILNNVNCQGKMGAGIGFHLKQRYQPLEKNYEDFINQVEKSYRRTLLGKVQSVQVEKNTHIFNIFGQQFYGSDKRYLSYDALTEGLEQVANMIGDGSDKIDIYMPHILGCDRAGGNMNIVTAILEETLGQLSNNIYAVKFMPQSKRYEGHENYDYYKAHLSNSDGGYRGHNQQQDNGFQQRSQQGFNRNW